MLRRIFFIDNYNPQEYFLIKFNEEQAKYKKPNVLICGYTGAGKTSIIQALLGVDIVSDNKISHGKPGTMDYDRYENDSIVVYDSKGLEPDTGEDIFIENIKTFIREKQEKYFVYNHIHIFWYVIQSVGSITKTDLRIINSFPKEFTIVVLSKKDIAKPKQLESIRAVLQSGTIKDEIIIQGGISEDRIIETTELDAGAKGICELYEKSLKILPQTYKKKWIYNIKRIKAYTLKQVWALIFKIRVNYIKN